MKKEKFWIKFYKNLDYNLYNIANGGQGGNLYDKSGNNNPMFNKKHSEQTIIKMIEKKKDNKYGNKLTFNQAQHIRRLYKNKKNNKLTYAKLSYIFNISFMSIRRIINNITYKKGERKCQ